MEYREKIKYAERVAEQLDASKTRDEVKAELKAEGLYEPDIVAVMISARNILGEKYLPEIREKLIAGEEIQNSDRFKSLDQELITDLIQREIKSLGLSEKNKIVQLLEKGWSGKKVLSQVDRRFLSLERASEHIVRVTDANSKNSSSTRVFNLVLGIVLIVVPALIYFGSGRLFYVLPILGAGMIIKGLMKHEV